MAAGKLGESVNSGVRYCSVVIKLIVANHFRPALIQINPMRSFQRSLTLPSKMEMKSVKIINL